MDFVMLVPSLGKALWTLKGMYDQHGQNKNEIKQLLIFIQDYDLQICPLQQHFKKVGGNVMGTVAFKTLEKDMMEATSELGRWLSNQSFFRVFTSAERMTRLNKLHSKVMASVQKNLGIANLSMLLDLQAAQAILVESNATLVDSNAQMKSLLISSIGSMHGTLPSKVRDEVVEASTSSFADSKFWEDILAMVDTCNGNLPSSSEDMGMFEDPITTHLMIDPVVCNDGNTYCRWTIIDNNVTTNPSNVDEELTINVDNLAFRRGLFEKFPKQSQIFRHRRNEYRCHALSLASRGLLGDAVLALQYVLQWDKRDVECVKCLTQVQSALQEAKEKYLQPSLRLSFELTDLPDACVYLIVLYLSPEDVARASCVSQGFRETLNSDLVWEQFVCKSAAKVVGSNDELKAATKKKIFSFLRKPFLVRETLAYWLDQRTGGACYSVAAKGLRVVWGDDRRYWEWSPRPGARWPEVACLLEVCWFHTSGSLKCELPPGIYTLSWRIQYVNYGSSISGWDLEPVEFSVSTTDGSQIATSHRYLTNNATQQRELGDLTPVRLVDDQWLEFDAGEIVVVDEEKVTSLEFSMAQTDPAYWKRGVILDGVVLRPSTLTRITGRYLSLDEPEPSPFVNIQEDLEEHLRDLQVLGGLRERDHIRGRRRRWGVRSLFSNLLP